MTNIFLKKSILLTLFLIPQVAKSASRIALYMMREECRDSGASVLGVGSEESSSSSKKAANSVQHTHDFFVISSCRVEVGLKGEGGGEGGEGKTISLSGVGVGGGGPPVQVPESFLPCGTGPARKILASHGLDLNGRSNNATERLRTTHWPKGGVAMEQFLASEQGKRLPAKERRELSALCDFVPSKEEMGVTGTELRLELLPSMPSLEERVRTLLSARVLLRTGVVETRLVASTLAEPWMLTSFRMTRTRDREKMPQVAKGPSFSTMSLDDDKGESNREEKIHHLKKRTRIQSKAGESSTDATEQQSADEPPAKVGRTTKAPDRFEPDCASDSASASTVAQAASAADWSKAEEVRFPARPWLRVDGTLNRRVFDRLLGAVLGHVMQRPGQSAEAVCARFSPALQPAHCRELVRQFHLA